MVLQTKKHTPKIDLCLITRPPALLGVEKMYEDMKTDTTVKDLAKLIYMGEDITNKALAARVGVNEKTIARWIEEGSWASMRKTLSTTKEEEIRNLYEILALLNRQNKQYLTDDDDETQPDADALIKITKAIHYLETKTGVGDVIDSLMQFIRFLQQVDMDLSKQVNKYADQFIKSKLNSN